MKIKRFEEIESWKVARILTNKVYKLIKTKSLDLELKNQIVRAAISIMNNIAEGFERDTDKDFKRFLFYAKGSCGEVRSMLYILLDNEKIIIEEFDELMELTKSCSKLLSKFIKYLKD